MKVGIDFKPRNSIIFMRTLQSRPLTCNRPHHTVVCVCVVSGLFRQKDSFRTTSVRKLQKILEPVSHSGLLFSPSKRAFLPIGLKPKSTEPYVLLAKPCKKKKTGSLASDPIASIKERQLSREPIPRLSGLLRKSGLTGAQAQCRANAVHLCRGHGNQNNQGFRRHIPESLSRALSHTVISCSDPSCQPCTILVLPTAVHGSISG